ncbi:phosphonate C-P lyase system protein PhnH [Yersinia frederiksenii]|uniref:phosphonate C-P lyase system protein PhnH n=1 Tax=Yersinia frederiksenii TaxID=29484 RepID=UPI0025AAAB84|nr:phosphonate C-P lyase system protein PhnH [Yersinia frederiksenii]MDN0118039.1 phosphonate C-P lyase system protein PhnH [Yersinia frederiksenii]
MSLLSHFDHPVEDSQHTFRRILKALSEPGVLVALPHSTGWQPLNPATTSLLLTLVDQETPLFLDEFLNSDTAQQNVRFHTGAPLTACNRTACFALFSPQITEKQLADCPAGNELSPEHSVTVIIQTDSLHQGTPLRLRGPGIEHDRRVAPCLPAVVLNYLLNRPVAFPAGIDFLLTCGGNLMAIPRTTHVEVC